MRLLLAKEKLRVEGKESGCGKDGKNFFFRIAGLQTEHARTSRKSRNQKREKIEKLLKKKAAKTTKEL